MASWLPVRSTPERVVPVESCWGHCVVFLVKSLYSHSASLRSALYSCFNKSCPKNVKAYATMSKGIMGNSDQQLFDRGTEHR